MKRALCRKPCTIGGRAFAIGEEIPMERIAPERLAALIQCGLIAVEDAPDEPNAGAQNQGGKSRGGRRKA